LDEAPVFVGARAHARKMRARRLLSHCLALFSRPGSVFGCWRTSRPSLLSSSASFVLGNATPGTFGPRAMLEARLGQENLRKSNVLQVKRF